MQKSILDLNIQNQDYTDSFSPNANGVESAVASIVDPYLGRDWLSLGFLKERKTNGYHASLNISLPYPAKELYSSFREEIGNALIKQGFQTFDLQINLNVPRLRPQMGLPGLEKVKNILVVASGKGGVGKSTTAANLALALATEGARVGILDADIYGPSQPLMLGIPSGTKPDIVDNTWFKPIIAHGIDTMSIGYLLDTDNTPIVWRGPKATGALLQLLTQTLWNDLDYLIVDMPPGTGDIPLTLAQKVPLAGAVIVTTPQDIALLDAKKGVEMFRKVEVSVLGVIENMATHICTNCGHTEHIFGVGGGDRISREYQTELLGSLPLDLHIREQADSGIPSVIADPNGSIAMNYRDIARRVGAVTAKGARQDQRKIPNIITT